jgi:hypothetical protein
MVIVRGGTELVKSGRTAEAEQAGSILHFTLESVAAPPSVRSELGNWNIRNPDRLDSSSYRSCLTPTLSPSRSSISQTAARQQSLRPATAIDPLKFRSPAALSPPSSRLHSRNQPPVQCDPYFKPLFLSASLTCGYYHHHRHHRYSHGHLHRHHRHYLRHGHHRLRRRSMNGSPTPRNAHPTRPKPREASSNSSQLSQRPCCPFANTRSNTE